MWSSWSDWSGCSVTCGDQGVRIRTRRCDSPAPQYGGRQCRGQQTQEDTCSETVTCPDDDIIPGLDSNCGSRMPGISQFRVVGGKPAKLHAHPWIAALGYRHWNCRELRTSFSAAKAALDMQMSVSPSFCLSVCHAYLFVRFTSIFYNSKSYRDET